MCVWHRAGGTADVLEGRAATQREERADSNLTNLSKGKCKSCSSEGRASGNHAGQALTNWEKTTFLTSQLTLFYAGERTRCFLRSLSNN